MLGLTLVSACYTDPMVDQQYHEPLEEPVVFIDRPRMPENVVPFDTYIDDSTLVTGTRDGNLVQTGPIPTTAELLARGQERFDIFCSPCHDRAGTGTGIVIRRGFRSQPSSFHIDRLRDAPDGYFFDIISNGFGAMQDYGAQIPPADRWAIVSYVRALQLSQYAPIDAVPEDVRTSLEETR
jgi:mono/diheme cytochrome c family protein